jgi:hypothetical protein
MFGQTYRSNKKEDREFSVPDPLYIPDARGPGPEASGLRPLVPQPYHVALLFLHLHHLFLEGLLHGVFPVGGGLYGRL